VKRSLIFNFSIFQFLNFTYGLPLHRLLQSKSNSRKSKLRSTYCYYFSFDDFSIFRIIRLQKYNFFMNPTNNLQKNLLIGEKIVPLHVIIKQMTHATEN